MSGSMSVAHLREVLPLEAVMPFKLIHLGESDGLLFVGVDGRTVTSADDLTVLSGYRLSLDTGVGGRVLRATLVDPNGSQVRLRVRTAERQEAIPN